MTLVVEHVPGPAPASAYQPRGGSLEMMLCKDPEVLVEGPWGTGKTRGILEKLHLLASAKAGVRILIMRKTRASCTESILVTFEQRVLTSVDRTLLNVDHVQRTNRHSYRYPNGSEIVVGGMDQSTRIFSTEWDVIFYGEAIEATEDEVEKLGGRLRNDVLAYQQLILDTNPGHPTHWLNKRALRGDITRILSRHADNPTLIDSAGNRTQLGKQYLGRLDKLTGVRRARYLEGKWAAAEGAVYGDFDATYHVIDNFLPPTHWRRIWSVDFGYKNAFVWQEWLVDPDGRLYLYREIYYTGRLIEEHALRIKELTAGDRPPDAVVCDHDAQGRATFEKYAEVVTRPAHKLILPGIQAVASRLQPAGDGIARLFFMRDALVERDPLLDEPDVGAPLPASTTEEFDAYLWPPNQGVSGKSEKELPVDRDNHGMDAMRYAVAYEDAVHRGSVGKPPPPGSAAYQENNRTIIGDPDLIDL